MVAHGPICQSVILPAWNTVHSQWHGICEKVVVDVIPHTIRKIQYGIKKLKYATSNQISHTINRAVQQGTNSEDEFSESGAIHPLDHNVPKTDETSNLSILITDNPSPPKTTTVQLDPSNANTINNTKVTSDTPEVQIPNVNAAPVTQSNRETNNETIKNTISIQKPVETRTDDLQPSDTVEFGDIEVKTEGGVDFTRETSNSDSLNEAATKMPRILRYHEYYRGSKKGHTGRNPDSDTNEENVAAENVEENSTVVAPVIESPRRLTEPSSSFTVVNVVSTGDPTATASADTIANQNETISKPDDRKMNSTSLIIDIAHFEPINEVVVNRNDSAGANGGVVFDSDIGIVPDQAFDREGTTAHAEHLDYGSHSSPSPKQNSTATTDAAGAMESQAYLHNATSIAPTDSNDSHSRSENINSSGDPSPQTTMEFGINSTLNTEAVTTTSAKIEPPKESPAMQINPMDETFQSFSPDHSTVGKRPNAEAEDHKPEWAILSEGIGSTENQTVSQDSSPENVQPLGDVQPDVFIEADANPASAEPVITDSETSAIPTKK